MPEQEILKKIGKLLLAFQKFWQLKKNQSPQHFFRCGLYVHTKVYTTRRKIKSLSIANINSQWQLHQCYLLSVHIIVIYSWLNVLIVKSTLASCPTFQFKHNFYMGKLKSLGMNIDSYSQAYIMLCPTNAKQGKITNKFMVVLETNLWWLA